MLSRGHWQYLIIFSLLVFSEKTLEMRLNLLKCTTQLPSPAPMKNYPAKFNWQDNYNNAKG